MSNTETFVRIDKKELEEIYLQVLVKYGFTLAKAKTCASVFTQNSIDGIYSHSVNRFAKFIEYVKNKYVLPDQEPEKVSGFGGIEQWNGNQGAGVLNAVLATGRACELSLLNGIGCVALANTNHWMRGGFYGWKAAKVGFAFIGWTNTIANMPAWKALDNKLGNNPLVIAIPFAEEAIVLDMAVSQYSFGAIEMHFLKKEQLPFPGGYDAHGKLSNDPKTILDSKKSLPAGYWKGAGLSLLLDILATILSGGSSVSDITSKGAEFGLSQVFIAIHLNALKNYASIETLIQQVINDYQQSVPAKAGEKILYPGERVILTRKENTEKGIPVAVSVWNEILAL